MKKITFWIILLIGTMAFSQEAAVRDFRTDQPIKYDRNGIGREVIKTPVLQVSSVASVMDYGKSSLDGNMGLNSKTAALGLTREMTGGVSVKEFSALNPDKVNSDKGLHVFSMGKTESQRPEDTCFEENPNDFTFENGYNCSSASDFGTANDLTVAAGEDFTLEKITASIFANGGIANVDVNYFSNASGLPGTLIGSETSVTITSQNVIGSNFGIDVNEIELEVTPFTFHGQAGAPTTYWIELSVTDVGSTGSVFWVVTSSTMKGNPVANYNSGWGNPDPAMDGVYKWEGQCNLLGIANNELSGFTYYPNPSSGILNIAADKNIESVALYNMLGQKVIDTKIGAASSYINIANLSTGTYIMKVSVDGQIGTYKVVKQ